MAEGKAPEVMLRPDLTNEQAQLAWEAIEANYWRFQAGDEHGGEVEGQVVEHVALRGLAGKTVRLAVGETLMGHSQEAPGLSSESIRLLFPALRRNRNLTKLDLSHALVAPALARELAAILRRVCPHFSTLTLRGAIPLGKVRTSTEVNLNKGVGAHIKTLQVCLLCLNPKP